MIRCIAAIDEKRGLANEHGIPWRLPADIRHFRDATRGSAIVMGYNTYLEFSGPLPERVSYVVSHNTRPLRQGYTAILDVRQFLQLHARESVWIIGGAALFAQTIDLASELYLTQIMADFQCTKFFPDYRGNFELLQQSELFQEQDIQFRYEIWQRKSSTSV
jgi:dihydrofolate reductase